MDQGGSIWGSAVLDLRQHFCELQGRSKAQPGYQGQEGIIQHADTHGASPPAGSRWSDHPAALC